jgi:transcriptional regulator GlxA family with amidase domain
MKRQELLLAGSAGMLAAFSPTVGTIARAQDAAVASIPNRGRPLRVPGGPINVAFVIGPMATVIDFTGPWEVFQDGLDNSTLYTVAATSDPVEATAGLMVLPHYTFKTAPQPHVIVVGAQRNLPESIAWVREASAKTDVTMSVCTGAFLVARAGLFDGQYATTHHEFYDKFAALFPKVKLVRGQRFVENPGTSAAGGLTSGMDLALRVVERYYGADHAQQTAYYMEYKRNQRPTLTQA